MEKTTRDIGPLLRSYCYMRDGSPRLWFDLRTRDGGIFSFEACYHYNEDIRDLWVDAHERGIMLIEDILHYKRIPPEDVDAFQRERSREQSERERQRIIRNRSSSRDDQWTR